MSQGRGSKAEIILLCPFLLGVVVDPVCSVAGHWHEEVERLPGGPQCDSIVCGEPIDLRCTFAPHHRAYGSEEAAAVASRGGTGAQ